MSELRKGQKVRVTYEAVYDHASDGSGDSHIVVAPSFSDKVKILVPAYANASIEVIEDLQPGDVYRTADGNALMYLPATLHDDMPWVGPCPRDFCRDIRHRDDCVTRPLTLLVRDGQPVTS